MASHSAGKFANETKAEIKVIKDRVAPEVIEITTCFWQRVRFFFEIFWKWYNAGNSGFTGAG